MHTNILEEPVVCILDQAAMIQREHILQKSWYYVGAVFIVLGQLGPRLPVLELTAVYNL